MSTVLDNSPQAVATAPDGLHPLRGNAVLARYGDLTLVCEAVPGRQHRIGALLDAVAGIAAGEADARQLSRQVAGLIGAAAPDGDDFPALCAFGPTHDGLAAIVHGGAELIVTVNGEQVHLDGRDAVTVLDRVITDRVDAVRAVVGGTDLGTVNGSAAPAPAEPVTAEPGQAAPPAEPVQAETVQAEPVQSAPAAPIPTPVPAQPAAAVRALAEPALVQSAPAPARPTPASPTQTPTQTPTQNPAAPVTPAAPESTSDSGRARAVANVSGVRCGRDHFNDPAVSYCSVCGLSMVQAPRSPEVGPRPQLGVLVLDDGTTVPLVRDVLLGRMPETDEAVAAGDVDAVTLADPLVSRRHARIVLRDWQVVVVDLGSANGTFVMPRGTGAWSRLEPGTETVLEAGSVIAAGMRQLRYFSHRHC
ncbi:FHA domain-containing protein [Amycolatopsis sp. NPDC026612]|uniref:FHA domain-containing protein n=1 Tax=Amycolatopsis sp. NPDC026612 TaxID=3155466 RepID=UPI0033C2E241